ncbi:DUF2334 domain-containing protein, partial [Frankia sp. CiP3]|uniref:DUF2334 domain-containing protein n=1 Tax=Frankia sp. CiP3 TaxID=2880971 RepID=UPI001EF6BA4F
MRTRRSRSVVLSIILAMLALVVGLTSTATTANAERPHSRRLSARHGGDVVALAGGKLVAPPPPPSVSPPRRGPRPVPPPGTGAASTTQPASGAPGAAARIRAAAITTVATAPAGTLVLYDTTGQWGWLGEQYAIQTANLVSHFGTWRAHPVAAYTAGEMAGYAAVVYIGSTYDEQVPTAFLTDVLAGTRPVVWMYDNIWQLTAQSPAFTATYGWNWSQFDVSSVAEVRYKNTSLTRYAANGSGIMNYATVDTTKATVLAQAVRADGTTFPWALRSNNLTYIGEIPYSYADMTDRYLALSDVLFDALAPATQTRHRALVRIEDVGPDADPAELRSIADYLSSVKVPFSVAVYPRYRDPNGVYNNGTPVDITLANEPAVVSALTYMVSKGGTLLMHGYTHQYSNVANPYSGVSADDFEFFRAHIDALNNVVYDGPVPEDSQAWAAGRINSAATAFTAAGLPAPTTFEFPHYAGSAADYRAVVARFPKRYERALYFRNQLAGGTIDSGTFSGQFFPYPVTDVYGTYVIPENIGNIEPEPFNNHPARLPADLIDSARRNLVVRDGFASFFYHPYLGTSYLRDTVSGIKKLGYTFVAAGGV